MEQSRDLFPCGPQRTKYRQRASALINAHQKGIHDDKRARHQRYDAQNGQHFLGVGQSLLSQSGPSRGNLNGQTNRQPPGNRERCCIQVGAFFKNQVYAVDYADEPVEFLRRPQRQNDHGASVGGRHPARHQQPDDPRHGCT